MLEKLTERFIKDPGIDDLPSEGFRDFYRIWQDLIDRNDAGVRPERVLPHFAEHLPLTVWFNYHSKTGKFLTRYVGNEFIEATGYDGTGSFLDDFDNNEGATERFLWVAQNERPSLALGLKFVWSPIDYKSFDALGCPLFNHQREVESLIYRMRFSK